MLTHPTRILGGFSVPDTPLITQAIALAKSQVSTEVFNHVMRSWLLGHYIASQLPSLQDRDIELHAITAILHDLGWSENSPLVSSDKRFEVDGANATREFLAREGGGKWDKHRLQLAWDAVALHSSPSIAMFKEAEVAACSAGIIADLTGWERAHGGVLNEEVWAGIAREFPRDGLKDACIGAFCRLCIKKPETTYDNLAGDFGVKFVEGYSRVGKRVLDIVEALED